jgi:hypothetical protein
MKRTLLAICSDLHGGHRHGLLNPETVLHEYDENGAIVDDYHPTLNPVQVYLWRIYQSQIAAIGASAGSDDVIVMVNGDVTAGIKHKSLLVSDRLSDQVTIARYNMEPWYALPHVRAVRFTKGTGAHVFEEGSSELLVAEMERGYHPEISTQVHDHSLITIDGLVADISHHGPPPGSRNWLVGNEARYYLRSLMMDELSAGRTPPRIVYRGHYHRYIQETLTIEWGGNFHTSTLVITPSFTFPDGYTRKVVRSPARVTHGMVITEIIDGELLRVIPLIKTLDIRTKETL